MYPLFLFLFLFLSLAFLAAAHKTIFNQTILPFLQCSLFWYIFNKQLFIFQNVTCGHQWHHIRGVWKEKKENKAVLVKSTENNTYFSSKVSLQKFPYLSVRQRHLVRNRGWGSWVKGTVLCRQSKENIHPDLPPSSTSHQTKSRPLAILTLIDQSFGVCRQNVNRHFDLSRLNRM